MKLLLTFTGAIAALIGSKSAFAEYTLNMTKGITDISQDIYWLHMMAFWVCVAIGVVVFGAMFFQFNFFWEFEKKILRKMGFRV